MKNASVIRAHIKRKVRQKDLIPVRSAFDVPQILALGMQKSEGEGALYTNRLKDTARDYSFRNGTSFSRHFLPRLPFIVREDVEFRIAKRLKRKSATRSNLERFINTAVKHALKYAPVIENKFPFVDERCVLSNKAPLTRTNPANKPFLSNEVLEPISFDHHALMCDERLDSIARHLATRFTHVIQSIEVNEQAERGYLDALIATYSSIVEEMKAFCIRPPEIKQKHHTISEAERDIEAAIRRCLDPKYLIRKLKHLRAQYIEFSQIALDRVGRKKGQAKYVSTRSLTRWKHQQRESQQWVEAMAAYDEQTGIAFALDEVIKRTVSNQENRRIELVVRSRGDEERAIDLGYEGIFITWTLPSKYHRSSAKWNGSTVKEAHENLMRQWRLARAWFKKPKINIDWFGLRVAEPHRDGTPHAHMFLYVHPSQKQDLISICRAIATNEDSDELKSTRAKEARFKAIDCDPSQGTATGYIIKYISKNINGAHMPESDAELTAERVRAWASTHRIKQFSQSGAKPVGIWRQLRRASKLDTKFDCELEALRHAADKSRWNAFCTLAGQERLAYEEKLNQYGEITKRVIGIDWLGKVIETCSTKYSLVKKKDVKRLQEARSVSPWSTENKCNQGQKTEISPLEQALIEATGWSIKGVQCLLKPLSLGATVPIDKHASIKLSNGRLVVV